MGMAYEYGDDDRNIIAANDREEWRDARRFAPEYLSPRDCNHIGGIHAGHSTCTICGEGP